MDHSVFALPDIARLEAPVVDCLAQVTASLDDSRLDADLRGTLVAYWGSILEARRRRARGRVPAWSYGLGALHLMVIASEGGSIDARALAGARGCELYALSVTLFDAVEDDELEGPIAALSPAVCTNAALLIFVQACESLLEVVDGLATGSRTASTKAFVARSMTLGRAQHRDLQGVRPDGLERAARQAEEKTEAIPLAAELAALAMGCDMARVQTYAEIARSIGLLNQAANDLVDLYGKRESDDLRAGKWTLPLVAHFEQSDAAQREELVRLREALPGSLPRIRELLLAGGALTRVAQLIERVRRGVHERIRALGRTQAPIAMLGAHADAIASRLYKLSEVDR